MNEKLYPKGKVVTRTFIEDAPPAPAPVPAPVPPSAPPTAEPETPRVVIFDRNKAIEDEKKNKPKPIISAQTKAEMEAGKQTLRRLQGIE